VDLNDMSEREIRAALKYDPEALKNGIERAEKEIVIFQDAIEDQKKLIEQYKYYLLLQKMQKASIR
jgi:hypothetical protein